MSNGVICIVNGNSLLVCSIWLCTGALMGGLAELSYRVQAPVQRRGGSSEGPRLPLVAHGGTARRGTCSSSTGFSQGQERGRLSGLKQKTNLY